MELNFLQDMTVEGGKITVTLTLQLPLTVGTQQLHNDLQHYDVWLFDEQLNAHWGRHSTEDNILVGRSRSQHFYCNTIEEAEEWVKETTTETLYQIERVLRHNRELQRNLTGPKKRTYRFNEGFTLSSVIDTGK